MWNPRRDWIGVFLTKDAQITLIFGNFSNQIFFCCKEKEDNNLKSQSNSTSGSIILNFNVWIIISGKADRSIFWAFKSTNNVSITVLALNESQYENHKFNKTFFKSFILSNGSLTSDDGNFSVLYFDFWHIYFINLDPIEMNTTLNFTVKFFNNEDFNGDHKLEISPNSIILPLIISIIGIPGFILTILFVRHRNKKYKSLFDKN